MGPAGQIGHRGADGGFALRRYLFPRPRTHPVVDEPFRGAVQVARLEGQPCLGHHLTNGIRRIGRWCLGIEQGKQCRFVQGHGTHPGRVLRRGHQRHGGAIGMAHQDQRLARRGQHGFSEGHFVTQGDDPVGRPCRTPACAP
ncbi:hypothetical protein D3C71_1521690 [compost metagenome]